MHPLLFFFSKETYFVDSRVLFPHSILQPDCFHIKWIKDERVACILPLPHWGGKTLYVSLSKDMCQCPSEGKGSFPPPLLYFPSSWVLMQHQTSDPFALLSMAGRTAAVHSSRWIFQGPELGEPNHKESSSLASAIKYICDLGKSFTSSHLYFSSAKCGTWD